MSGRENNRSMLKRRAFMAAALVLVMVMALMGMMEMAQPA